MLIMKIEIAFLKEVFCLPEIRENILSCNYGHQSNSAIDARLALKVLSDYSDAL
jgi:hypothetical protein